MRTPVETTTPDTPLADAVRRMYERRVSCLVVDMDDAGSGFGILTQKDALNILLDSGPDLKGLLVSEAMTHPAVVVSSDYTVQTCMQLMRMLGVRRACATNGATLVGLVSFTDVFRFAVESES